MSKKEAPAKKERIKKGSYAIAKAVDSKYPKSMMIYGEPKHGKTWLACSICKVPWIKKVLLVDIDGGDSAIASDFPEVDVVKFSKYDMDGFYKFWAELMASPDWMGYDAVIVDTVTTLQKWLLKSLPRSLGYARWDEGNDMPDQILTDLHNMGPVGISLFHTELFNSMKGSSDDSYVKMMPLLKAKEGKMSIGAIPDLIGFLAIEDLDDDEEAERVLRLDPSDQALAGNRFNKLPPELASPTMKRLYELIETGV